MKRQSSYLAKLWYCFSTMFWTFCVWGGAYLRMPSASPGAPMKLPGYRISFKESALVFVENFQNTGPIQYKWQLNSYVAPKGHPCKNSEKVR